MMRHLLTMSPKLKFSNELVEGDDECAIGRYGVRGQANEADGGGELDLTVTHIAVARHGLICHMERHAADVDIDILRARHEELRPLARRRPGIDLPPVPLASERALPRLIEVLDAGEWETLADLLDPGLALVDHRRVSVLGDEIRDRDAYLARERSLFENAVECTRKHYEVIAATDTAYAAIVVVRGSMADGGGPFEIAVGVHDSVSIGWAGPASATARRRVVHGGGLGEMGLGLVEQPSSPARSPRVWGTEPPTGAAPKATWSAKGTSRP